MATLYTVSELRIFLAEQLSNVPRCPEDRAE
jgi:hypothetical protein